MNTEDVTDVAEMLPHEVYEELKQPGTVLVDVRTKAEWAFVGIPDLDVHGGRVLFVEWLAFPEMAVNPKFAGDLFSNFGDTFPERAFFICRSGVRSLEAAEYIAEIIGEMGRKTRCINVSEGFEGDLDQGRHRANMTGWKKRSLPWRQT